MAGMQKRMYSQPLFLRFDVTIKGGIKFDKGSRTFQINYFRFCL